MKKIYSFLFAAVAMFAVASCSEEIAPEVAPEQNPQEEVVTPSETIKVEFTATRDVETKTTLTDGQTAWEASESIAINGVEFTNTAEATATFSAEVDPGTFVAPYIAVYPYSADYDYENTTVSNVTVAAEQTVAAGNFSSQKPVEIAYQTEAGTLAFKNVCSILQFQVPDFGETITSVTITSDKPIAGTGVVSYNGGVPTVTGAAEYTVTLTGTFETGKTYYATVLPVEDAKLTIAINGYLSKETAEGAVDIVRSKIMAMEILPAPTESEYGVIGSFQDWNTGATIKMYETITGTYLIKNVELYKDDEFKIYNNGTWYGNGESNVTVDKNGLFDIVFNPSDSKITATCVEEYTDQTFDIAINNKEEWSPLYICVKNGDTFISESTGDVVEGGKYTIDANYLGSSLTYWFSNGSESTPTANFTFKRTGVELIVEQKVIPVSFTLNTDNSKQWWGNNAYMYVWLDDNTNPLGAWPGTQMTKEGDYTWKINLPYSLKGKKINYKFHNGNGWESSNASNGSLPEGGLSVQGSNIGVN